MSDNPIYVFFGDRVFSESELVSRAVACGATEKEAKQSIEFALKCHLIAIRPSE